MCTPAAGGLAASGLGTAVNAYGQDQALGRMRDVWSGQNARQAQYDQQLQAAQQQLLQGINPQAITGAQQAQARTATLDAGAKNLVAAAKANAGRKTGGSRGGAEARAAGAQATQGTLAQALAGDRLAGIIAGLQQGRAQGDMLGRTFDADQRRIRGDARQWSALAPLQEQAAGMHGGEARAIGSLFNIGGQAAMNYGLSRPTAATQAQQQTQQNALIDQSLNGFFSPAATWDTINAPPPPATQYFTPGTLRVGR